MPRALLSVSDKTGIVDLARDLVELGWEVLSTGGTARALRDAGLPVREVADVTGHPEMMEGRVKTLHPAIHAGLLARRENPDDMQAMEAQGYAAIDLVAVNLYPFRETVADGASLEQAMEQVDIGGPSMLRSAAKNHASVYVVVDPADYTRVLDALRRAGVPGGHAQAAGALRLELARKVFAHTSSYDAAIADFLGTQTSAGAGALHAQQSGRRAAGAELPQTLALRLSKVQDLRYGENPDQAAAFYAEADAPAGSLVGMRQLQGKELSFNNLLDADAAVAAISAWAEYEEAACAIIKHTTPCGIALGATAAEAFRRALAGDPVSAFGGIVALNVPVDRGIAEAIGSLFLELVIAPRFGPEAVDVLSAKKNLRLLELPIVAASDGELDYKRVRGGLLVQDRMRMSFPETAWKVVTHRAPSQEEWRDLRFAWRAVASIKSNAIVLARDGQTLGIGAGQMSRVDSSRLAIMKAEDQGHPVGGAALGSDAFFPFRDGIDAAAAAGVKAVVQPGGSVRDEEVVAAADEHGIAMVFTGRRVFRH